RRWLKERSAPFVDPLRARYHSWPTYWQHFAVCFALGIVIETGIHLGHGLPMVADWQRWGFDKTVSMLQTYRAWGWIDGEPLPGGYSRFIWVDIDEDSWSDERWGGGEPFLQPRREVLELVDRAFAWGARVVYVDLLLDGTAGDFERQWLAALQRRTFPGGEPRHLLTARSLRQPLASSAGSFEAHAPPKRPRLRAAFWDTYQAPPGGVVVHPVLPRFLSDSDLRVRRWSIGQTAATGNADRFLPSPQLALYCLQPARHPPLAAWCERITEAHAPASGEHPEHAGEHAGHDALASTLLFPLGSNGRLGYSLFPALTALANAQIDEFRNAIVVIGGSYEESRDHFHTPVGRLPGALLNLNALDTMLRYGQLRELPWQAKWPLVLGLMVLVAALFAFGKRLVATVVAGGLVAVGFIFVVGPLLLRYGLWFDFGSPLLGIYLHRNIEEWHAAHAHAEMADDGHHTTHLPH
ncbi:CHASE2 domain-containing protein, partial [Candidatus Accumulibacter vicinus]